MSPRQRIILSALIVFSMLICLFAAALQAGYEHPIQTSDSKGNQLGFCNSLTWELTGILLRSATLKTVVQSLGFYGCLYLFAHALAFFFIATNSPRLAERRTASWFWIQFLVFPLSWLGLLALPDLIGSFFKGQIDGETISEFPFWWMFQVTWFAVSLAAGTLIWRTAKKIQIELTQFEIKTDSAN